MEILPLLRKRLKDDEIIELLEWIDAKVIYDFDRSHENMPDVYWATGREHGITLRFDESQILHTVFIYMQPGEEHEAADRSLFADIAFFGSASEVQTHAADHGIRVATGSRPAVLPPAGSWVRLDYDHHRVHYDFGGGTLSIVTISTVDEPNVA
jgi:hypothetical protein